MPNSLRKSNRAPAKTPLELVPGTDGKHLHKKPLTSSVVPLDLQGGSISESSDSRGTPLIMLPLALRETPLSDATEKAISPEEPTAVEHELQHVLNSKTFSKSPRLKRFLEYVVKRSIIGEHKALKEYTLGLDVFDRDSSFDPSRDPIVRVEALRLRVRLSAYYETEGVTNSLRIDLPKGRYIPIVRKQIHDRPTERTPAEHRVKTIIVLPFMFDGNPCKQGVTQSDAVSRELIHTLTQSSEVRVISRLSSTSRDSVMGARELGNHFGAQFIVEGALMKLADEYQILASLVESGHGYNLWSGKYQTTADTTIAIAETIASDLMLVLRGYDATKSGVHSA